MAVQLPFSNHVTVVVSVISGSVVELATVHANPLAVITVTSVTVPHDVAGIYLSHVASELSATS